MHQESHKKTLIILLVVSALIRALFAGWMELGTDEAYYWTFAKYPDWSHFDHPGMLGWMMQFFTLNLLFENEFFLRLASVVFMTLNTWIMYCIGRELKDEATGLWSALLYTASVYAFVVTGIFTLPDTPLSLFWLLAFLMFFKYLKRQQNKHLLMAGLLIGLAILSKYTGAFLWFGFLLYILCFDRRQFRNPHLYLAMLITALCCLPIVIWNAQNDFISFRFHSDRVSFFGPLHPAGFFTELGGEFIYNNPVNFIVAIIAIGVALRKKLPINVKHQRLILITALPMIGLFLLSSLTRPTLPHWSGPAYVMLIPLNATWLSTIEIRKARQTVITALGFLVLTLILGTAEIKTGFVSLDHHTKPTELGRSDITLDLYGWRQAGEKFAEIHQQEVAKGTMRPDDAIIGHKWFPSASFHYYIARPLGINMLGYGSLKDIHKYMWINDLEGGLEKGRSYWYLADSHFFLDPEEIFKYTNFLNIKQIAIIPIERNGKTVRNIFVYECESLVYVPKLREY